MKAFSRIHSVVSTILKGIVRNVEMRSRIIIHPKYFSPNTHLLIPCHLTSDGMCMRIMRNN